MKSPLYARLAASLLARAPEPHASANANKRAATVSLLEITLRKKAARRHQVRWAGALFTLSAAAAGAFFVTRSPSPSTPRASAVGAIGNPTGTGAQLLTSSGSEALRGGAALPLGGRLVANPDGGAALRLSTGSELAIEQNANLLFSEAGATEHFVLSQGGLLAHVAKLHTGERFIVSTPDAEVEVHGTVFRVTVVEPDATCVEGGRTRVEVREGVVEVRGQNGKGTFVHPGERWPARCAPASAAQPDKPSPSEAPSPPSQPERPHAAGVSPLAKPANDALARVDEPATLAARALAKAQNDLFSQGLAARRGGDSAGAAAKFQALLTQYPASPLAENAAAERMRALAASNPAAAARAARAYLARYPRGFAASDANAILAGR